jgi:glyoxylase-like metal-dependent hydrolase (beta-lactamase superfamily II)/rhodanese-related sulfurtransferase
MILEQHYLACLSQASYLLGDEATRTAIVVDPRRDVDDYIRRASELGLVIRHVYLTHLHADFVAGHLELAARTGADIRLGRKARAEFEHVPLADGDELVLGSLRIVALETPGHTPEGVSLLVWDLADPSGAPRAVLTGDTLFVGDVGRPDLAASAGCDAAELASQLYDSVRRLAALPPQVELHPGHGAGSACGKSLGKETSSTIGAQLAANPMLAPMARERFVREALDGLPPAPAYFAHDARLNRGRRALLEDLLSRATREATLDEALELSRAGGLLLDARRSDDWARGHVAGSVQLGLDGRYASWAGMLLDPEARLILVCEPGNEREAAIRLLRVGFENVAGVLRADPAAWAARGVLRSTPRVDPAEARKLAEEPGASVLDVRAAGERDAVRIEGSTHIPLPELERRWRELDRGRRWIVHCAGGWRSTIACSLLEARGFDALVDVRGGMGAWAAAGLPCARGAGRGGAG